MKTGDAGFLAYLGGNELALAEVLKIKLASGAIHAITTHDEDISLNLADGDGLLTYSAALGFTRSSLPLTNELDPEEFEVTSAFGGEFTEANLLKGKLDRATFKLVLVRWDAPSLNNSMVLMTGILSSVEPQGALFKATFRGLKEKIAKKQIIRTYGPRCDADLGDARCTKNLTGLTQNGTVTGVTSKRQFAASAFPSPSPADRWNEGRILFTSGALSGQEFELRSYTHSTRTFVLKAPAPETITVGMTFVAIPGCDGAFSTCRDKFSNAVNFRGFHLMPEEKNQRRAPLVTPGGGYTGTGGA